MLTPTLPVMTRLAVDSPKLALQAGVAELTLEKEVR
jgi:hypothetical protein